MIPAAWRASLGYLLRHPWQLFLSMLMVLGRLELYALLVLFVPGAWRKY